MERKFYLNKQSVYCLIKFTFLQIVIIHTQKFQRHKKYTFVIIFFLLVWLDDFIHTKHSWISQLIASYSMEVCFLGKTIKFDVCLNTFDTVRKCLTFLWLPQCVSFSLIAFPCIIIFSDDSKFFVPINKLFNVNSPVAFWRNFKILCPKQ